MRKRLILVAALSFVALSAQAQQPTVRKELGTILLASRQALLTGDYGAALSDLAAADAVADKTPDEVAVVEQMRVVAALKASAPDVAAGSYQILNDMNRLPLLQKLQYSQGIAVVYYALGNRPGAAAWANHNIQLGGADPGMRQLAAQALSSAPAPAAPVYAIPPGVVPPSQ